jgi:RHS repeat-associated protein
VKNHKIDGGQWRTLGSYCGIKYVQVSAAAGKTAADAVRFLTPVPPGPPTWVETIGYIHADHLGTPRQVTDDAQSIIWRWDGTPFGDSAPNDNPDGDAETFVLNLRFPGHYYDAESGLHYNTFRDYDPATDRYLEFDPIGLAGGINGYIYANANPLIFTDPMGLATYMCVRPLHALGGAGERSGPDIPGNPLYHQFLCVRDSSGKVTCGGQDRTGSAFFPGSPGKPSDDSWNQSCDKEDNRKCVDDCVVRMVNNPQRPWYAIGPQGTDCQEWSDRVVRQCKKECKGKK